MLNFTNDLMRNFNVGMRNILNHFQGTVKNVPVAAIATSIVIIAGTYSAFRYVKNAYKNHNIVYTRSVSLGTLHGGKLALQRLIDYHQAKADAASLNAAETDLEALLATENPDFNKLQSAVAKLEMSGKEGVAVRVLEQEVERATRENKSQEAYEIEMLLVEMLIYKGDYQKALNCECLKREEISDARRPLYKAIIHFMLNDEKEASNCWEEFVEVREHFQSPPSLEEDRLHEDITDFNEFKNAVKVLKNDITEAHTPSSQRMKTFPSLTKSS